MPDPASSASAGSSAAKATDLEAIRKSVEDAASVSGSLWLSYLFLMFYLAIAAGAVSHTDLFVENPVKLPFLGIELPLKAFFLLAPLLFCISHVYTLTYFVILSDKAKRYHRELKAQIAGDDDPASDASLRAKEIRNELQRQLPSNIFVQFLAGPDDIRASGLGLILQMIAWVTLVVAPILLLLLLQVQFLPYHDSTITWTTRLSLLFDILVIWWLWRAILLGRGEVRRELNGWHVARSILAMTLCIAVLVFSWGIATFPGEWVQENVANRKFISGHNEMGESADISIHDFLFRRPISTLTRRRDIFLSSTLVLPHFDIFEHFKIKDPNTYGPYQYVLKVRGRDFRGAMFDLSNLSNVDFEGAAFDDASFRLATLHYASFYCASLDRSRFEQARLQGAWLHGAAMTDVKMEEVQAQGARFEGAHLEKAKLGKANLQGASFNSARLADADFGEADLRGASFQPQRSKTDKCVSEQDAALGADLTDTAFGGALLHAASFRDAHTEERALASAKVDDSTDLASGAHPLNQTSLATHLKELVCSRDTSALFVLRGLLATDRLNDAGTAAGGLAQSIEDEDCGLADTLSAGDKSYLYAIAHTAASRREN